MAISKVPISRMPRSIGDSSLSWRSMKGAFCPPAARRRCRWCRAAGQEEVAVALVEAADLGHLGSRWR